MTGSTDPTSQFAANGQSSFRIAILTTFLIMMLSATIGIFCRDQIDHALFRHQDFWLMIVVFLAIIVTQYRKSSNWGRQFELHPSHLFFLALIVFIFCTIGHYTILSGFNLSRDEKLADFDAWIYARGQLAWPLPAVWQREANALNLMFMMPVRQPVAWVSSYLPMNAAIRAMVGTVATPAITGPLLTALSLPLLWGCARRLWPEDREAAVVAVALLASSGQFLFTGMTAFAMPAHLFFNLLWLWLFVRDKRGADLLALVAGFVATGLHQPLFHPLFVVPWLALLLYRKQYRRLAIYAAGYALICAFWLWWPHFAQSLVTGPASLTQAGSTSYWSRLVRTLGNNEDNLQFMGLNLLRLCTWQNVILLPLVIVGLRDACRSGTGLALVAGLLLPIVVMAIILPAQGFGFGYRYLHPVLGNAALLAAIGWRRLGSLRDGMRRPFLWATALSVLVMLPTQAWMTHQLFSMVAKKDRQLKSSGVDYVVLPNIEPGVVPDFADNRPDLSNRPLILLANRVRDLDGLAARLCQPDTKVALASDGMFKDMKRYFQTVDEHDRAWLSDVTNTFSSAGCSVKILR